MDSPDLLELLPQRLSDKVRIDETGCWLWTGAQNGRGYGHLTIKRRNYKAHRVIYEMLCGPVPSGMELDHLCHNRDAACIGGWSCLHRACVRPDHLEPVTRSENMLRGRNPDVQRHRAAQVTHCPQGHAYDDANTRMDRRGCRRCRACDREYMRRQRLAKAS